MTINALSAYAQDELLDHICATGAFTMPTATWLQLHVGDPGEAGTANVAAFTTRTEVTAWDAAAALATANTNAIIITPLTNTETISWWSVHDASTAGNHLFYGQLTTGRAVENSDTLTFAAGELDLDFDSTDFSTFLGNALLDHLTGTTAMTAPTNLYVQMHIGAPGLAGTANVASITTRTIAGAFSVSSGGATDNDALIAFTGVGSETLSHWTLFDASTVGNCYWQDALTVTKAVVASEAIEIAAGALDLAIS